MVWLCRSIFINEWPLIINIRAVPDKKQIHIHFNSKFCGSVLQKVQLEPSICVSKSDLWPWGMKVVLFSDSCFPKNIFEDATFSILISFHPVFCAMISNLLRNTKLMQLIHKILFKAFLVRKIEQFLVFASYSIIIYMLKNDEKKHFNKVGLAVVR